VANCVRNAIPIRAEWSIVKRRTYCASGRVRGSIWRVPCSSPLPKTPATLTAHRCASTAQSSRAS